ncbi:MAG TPA: alpha-amylase family glycosyl hydrolase [Verrucomicrobiae bacterium]|nr:alpha-amylase family glycosyl hydrolase [Verrucomicrobiae bacterium]
MFKLGHFTAVISVLLISMVAADAQSSRPGWGATPYGTGGTGVTFRVWAPHASKVYVPGQFNGWSTTAQPLGEETSNGMPDGIWSGDVSTAVTNQQYKYYVIYNGSGIWKHDPRARYVTVAGSSGNDIIYAPTNFNWNGDAFTPPAISDLFIYELHMGTFPPASKPSRFVDATNQLPYLKSLGVNAVEIMPIAEFGNTGNSWGYDPAQIFAVDNSQYGGPDGLKTFVKTCHAYGIAVLLDVVHNHYGPNLLDMWDFDGWAGTNSLGGGGIYFYQSDTNLQITPWGYTRPNFSSNQVCSFIEDNFTMWLSEYHVDGFRWDTPGAMMNDNANNYIPDAGNLIASINDLIHTNYSGKISIAEDVYDAFGFDSAWDTSYPYVVTPVLTNVVDSKRDITIIGNAIENNLRYGGAAGTGRVVFLESHDVVGDLNNGERLVTAIDPVAPNSYRARKLSTLGAAVTLTAPGIPMIFQGQEMLESEAFDSSTNVNWSKTNTYSYVVQFYRDLIGARRNLKGYTPGLEGNQCAILQMDNVQKLVSFHRWNSSVSNADAVVIANFAGVTNVNYSAIFPRDGTWYAHLNGDSTNYGPDYSNFGSTTATATGNPATASITIGPYSALIFSPTPDALPQMTITLIKGQANLSWPAVYAGWILESSTNLNANPAQWSIIPSSSYQTSGLTTYVIITPSSASTFYRLATH